MVLKERSSGRCKDHIGKQGYYAHRKEHPVKRGQKSVEQLLIPSRQLLMCHLIGAVLLQTPLGLFLC